jgi:hypothetical protein
MACITPRINKKQTIQNIIAKCKNSSYNIREEKFEEMKNNVQFIISAANLVKAEVVYKQAKV